MSKGKERRVAAYARFGTEEQLKESPRVIVYCRVAQKDRVALEYQRQRLLDYCEEKGYEVVLAIYETASATRERNILRRLFRRPKQKGLNIMRRMARKNKADGAVATTMSRLSRDTATTVGFVKALDVLGLFVETMQEGRLTDTVIPTLAMFA